MDAENIMRIEPLKAPLDGAATVPGDKSISHRAVLFSAMAEGTSRLTGVLDSADVRSSIDVVTALGAKVNLEVGVDGSLSGAPKAPSSPIIRSIAAIPAPRHACSWALSRLGPSRSRSRAMNRSRSARCVVSSRRS